jgi:hypothetical protein
VISARIFSAAATGNRDTTSTATASRWCKTRKPGSGAPTIGPCNWT